MINELAGHVLGKLGLTRRPLDIGFWSVTRGVEAAEADF